MITLITPPKDVAPVYNEMVFTASSDNTAQPGFSYLVDVYINGSPTKTARLRIAPEPTGNYLVVDVHRVLEAALSFDLLDVTNTAGSVDAPNSSLTYIIKFGEEYEVAGVLTQFADLLVDVSRVAFNGSLERDEFIDWDITAFDINGTAVSFLTNSPDTLYTSINDFGSLTYYNVPDPANYIVKTYDSAGLLLNTFQVATPSTSTIQWIPTHPASLNLIGADLVVGVQPIIDSAVASYTVEFDLTPFPPLQKKYIIREECKELTRLLFLNKYGAFDSFNFYGAANEINDIERKMYKKNPVRLDGAGNYTYSKADREKIQYYTKTKTKFNVKSDWITETEDAWLLELIESPVIYMQVGNELISVASVDLTTHKKRKHISEKVFNLELTIELGYDNYRQRG